MNAHEYLASVRRTYGCLVGTGNKRIVLHVSDLERVILRAFEAGQQQGEATGVPCGSGRSDVQGCTNRASSKPKRSF